MIVSKPPSKEYRDNWDRIFRPRPRQFDSREEKIKEATRILRKILDLPPEKEV